jgi:hypothetical protein
MKANAMDDEPFEWINRQRCKPVRPNRSHSHRCARKARLFLREAPVAMNKLQMSYHSEQPRALQSTPSMSVLKVLRLFVVGIFLDLRTFV